MASIISGYSYDIFISYRQKDNRHDGWVTEFVNNLKGELESTFKEEISVYFDINPHDGLLETHDVDASLREKLNCLIFIPIISRTYCDPKSFAWEHEFKAFVEMASKDKFGLKVKLPNGNIASRVLPVRIHELNSADIKECETLTGGFLRGIEFIYKEAGVNRPLDPDDDEKTNLNHTKYRNQINKTANAIEDLISGIKSGPDNADIKQSVPGTISTGEAPKRKIRNNVFKLGKTSLITLITLAALAIAIFMYENLLNINTIKKLRKSGEISIVVLPFRNLTGDSRYDFLETMVPDNLRNILSDAKELKVRQLETMNDYLNDQDKSAPRGYTDLRNISRDLKASLVIQGSIKLSGDKIRISAELTDPGTGQVNKPFSWDCDRTSIKDDSLHLKIRNYLLISILEKETPPDFRDFKTTDSPDAYRYYKIGQQANWDNDFVKAIEYSKMAVDKDSTFIAAKFRLALSYYNLGDEDPGAFSEAKKWISEIYDKRNTMPAIGQIWVEYTYALCFEEPYQAIECGKRMLKVDDQLPFGHYIQGHNYDRLRQYDKAIVEYEAALWIYNKWKSKPNWVANFSQLGGDYHKLKKYHKERRLYKRAEKDFPENDELLFNQVILALTEKNTNSAKQYLENFRQVLRRKSFPESRISKLSGDIYLEAGINDTAEYYYRKALAEDQSSAIKNALAYFLIDKDRNIDAGLNLAEECLSSDPDNYNYLHTIGWGLYKKARYEEARTTLQKSWDLRMQNAIWEYDAKQHLLAAIEASR